MYRLIKRVPNKLISLKFGLICLNIRCLIVHCLSQNIVILSFFVVNGEK